MIEKRYQLKCLESIQGLHSLLQVGASINTRKTKDIDYILITDEGFDVVGTLEKKLKWDNFKIIDDSIRFTLDNEIINIAIFNAKEFRERIDNIFNGKIYGEHREWVIGYWLPEAFLQDLMEAKEIFDKSFYITIVSMITDDYEHYIVSLVSRIKNELSICESFLANSNIPKIISKNKAYLAVLRLYNLTLSKPMKNYLKILDESRMDKMVPMILSYIESGKLLQFKEYINYCEEKIYDKINNRYVENSR